MEIQALTKEELLKLCEQKTSWSGREVKTAVSSMRRAYGIDNNASVIKVGDIGYALMHPCVVIKITKGIAHALIITSEKTCDSILMNANSRFFPEGFITYSLVSIKLEDFKIKGVYDNPRHIMEIRKQFKLHVKTLFKI